MQVQDIMSRNVVSIEAQHTLPDAVVTMTGAGVRRLPVMQEGQLVGVVSDDDIRSALPVITDGLTPWAFAGKAGSTTVRDVMRSPALTIEATADARDAVRVLLERRVGGLPVVDRTQRVVGMLTLTDVLRSAERDAATGHGAVREYMTRTAVSITPDATASEAAAYLALSRMRVLPVVDQGVLVGVVRQSDLRAAAERAAGPHGETFLQSHFFLEDRRVRDLMRAPADVVRAGVPLREAIRAMLVADVHGLPVVSDTRHLLGVITVSDVLTALLGRHRPVTSGAKAQAAPA